MNGPQYRTAQAPKKKALLVSSCAAPGILGRWFFGTDKQLKMTAKTIGAEVVGTLFTGMIAKKNQTRNFRKVCRRRSGLCREDWFKREKGMNLKGVFALSIPLRKGPNRDPISHFRFRYRRYRATAG